MEIGEVISTPGIHATPEDDCPFCPTPREEDKKKFKTYPGKDKDASRLVAIMENPDLLSSEDSRSRPKKGEPNQQQAASKKPYPASPLTHETFGPYTYEAHHLIPGNEKVAPGDTKAVMSGHAIEKWIVDGDKVDRDTGYSINNSDNGTWLPSATKANKKDRANPSPARPWASEQKMKNDPLALSLEEKRAIAYFAMQKGAGQFHYGQHKILDDEGKHYTYAKEVEERLSKLENLLAAWAETCRCDQSTKPPLISRHGRSTKSWTLSHFGSK
jgi:hypothetical protein